MTSKIRVVCRESRMPPAGSIGRNSCRFVAKLWLCGACKGSTKFRCETVSQRANPISWVRRVSIRITDLFLAEDLADGYDEGSERYLGLIVGPGGGAPVSGTTLLVRPELAVAQAEADRAVAATPVGVGADAGDGAFPGPKSGTGVPPVPGTAKTEPAKPKRFHGSVVLRSERLNLEFGRVVQEVVQRLVDAGAGVEVTVEVSATSREGFGEPAVRTVTENARTLRFRDLGFEDE